MLRGFRWQLVALITAALLFAFTLVFRSQPGPQPVAPTNSVSASTEAVVSQSPTVENTPSSEPDAQSATPLPLPENNLPTDGVTTYREGLIGRVDRLNPLLVAGNTVEQDITSLIFEGLTRSNEYGEPEPALAESWVISSDGLEYIVRLRHDVLWQDGVPFTADDVIYTFALLRSPEFPGDPDVGLFWRTVETEKLGDDLVRFRLTQPLGSFLDALRIGLLPFHALQGTPAEQLATHPINLTPIGTGPYQLESIRTDGSTIRQVDLRVAPTFRARPEGQSGYALDRVSFRLYDNFNSAENALLASELDGLATNRRGQRRALSNAENDGVVNLHTKLAPDLGVLIFNWANEETSYFAERRVRFALQVGVDRASIVERNLTNQAILANSPLLPGSWAFISDLVWPAYDPNAARGLMETAFAQLGQDEAESTPDPNATEAVTAEAPASSAYFTFTILTPEDQALQNMAQEIATQWSQLNLDVRVETVPEDQFQARLESGDFDAALVQLSLASSADPDVYEFWHQGQYPDGRNYGGVADSRISDSLERARMESNGLNRIVYYETFQHEFVERAIALPLYYPLYSYATSSRVDGVQLGFIGTSADRFRNIGEWTVQ